MTTPEAVVFDLGNVLIGWDPYPAIAAGVGADEAHRFLEAEDFDFMAWNHLQDAGGTWDAAEGDVLTSHPHWAEHARAYRANFAKSLIGAIEDTVTVLRDLHAAGVPLFALTNWSHELFPHALERFDFLALFDDIVVSGTEGFAKPGPEIFAELRTRVARPLERCVFVDDKPENVAAASKAGLDALLFVDARTLRHDLHARGLALADA
jgi:2-haloacid dehalogenase